MSSLTTNLKLVKPELQDNITPTIFADNFDKIDAALEGVSGGALSLEEIEASTNLDGKIPSAAALKEVNNSLQELLTWHEVNAVTDIPTTAKECMFIFKNNFNSCSVINVPYETLELGLSYPIMSYITGFNAGFGYIDITITKNSISYSVHGNYTSCELYKCYYR